MADRLGENILLIGDGGDAGGVRAAVAGVLPAATVVSADTVFDGIAALSADAARPPAGRFTTVLAAAEPFERRPEAAVRVLRELAGDGRLVLFGHSTLELLSRKMARFGCDDYLVTPASGEEVRQMFAAPNPRLAAAAAAAASADVAEPHADRGPAATPANPGSADAAGPGPAARPGRGAHRLSPAGPTRTAPPPPPTDPTTAAADALDAAAAGGVLLDALLKQPHDPIPWAVRQVNARLAPAVELSYDPPGRPAPARGDDGREVLELPVPAPDADAATASSSPAGVGGPDGHAANGHAVSGPPADGPGAAGGVLRAAVRDPADRPAALAVLRRLAPLVAKAAALSARHAALQRMAITDELTGVYNARYFRHFLQRILEKARQMHFPVTLLMFDIDDFKGYNDRFGHQVGDEILRQTAAMMKRCTREHDLVARVGGDEFAVVFWDKEGPRQPREPRHGNVSRPPQSPVQVFERFKRMIQGEEFTALGEHGQGKLGISAGLAVYPYEGHDVEALIAEADRALMQGSKRNGKNRLSLVGDPQAAAATNGVHP